MTVVTVPPCPECRDGKCKNCAGQAIDPESDELLTSCPCADRGHAQRPEMLFVGNVVRRDGQPDQPLRDFATWAES
jgi:hypothetical protein